MIEKKIKEFERQIQAQPSIDQDSEDQKAKQTKFSKKENTNTKRSASKLVEPEMDRSKATGTNNSIERIALFGEGSETGTNFVPIEISQA